MPKKKTPNDLYWDSLKKEAIRKEYKQFITSNCYEDNPDNAALFSIKAEQEGLLHGSGMDRRALIIYLAGSLPYAYD